MSSFNNPPTPTFDNLLLQTLMGRLQLRPPYLDTNSFLSQSLDDFLLPDDSDDAPSAGGRERSLLAKEEAKLEKEIVRIVQSGTAHDVLKPNSGQSVAIGDHHICVGFHEEPESEYRVWEWHGHVMLFDEENGYSPEYVYGNYFERVKGLGGERKVEEKEEVEEEEDGGFGSGLKDLIAGGREEEGRVVHRNSLNSSR